MAAMLPLLATASTAASSVVASGAAALQSALSVHCATVHNENLNDANRIKDEFGRGRSTEVSGPGRPFPKVQPLTVLPSSPPSSRFTVHTSLHALYARSASTLSLRCAALHIIMLFYSCHSNIHYSLNLCQMTHQSTDSLSDSRTTST